MTNEIQINLKEITYNTSTENKCEITYFDYNNLQYSDFYENVMMKNSPCLIRNVADSWECSKNWVLHNNINYGYFIDKYGHLEAPVADCDSINFNAQCKFNMKVKDFMEYLQQDDKNKLLYLKDWHLRRVMPDHKFYEVPFIFASDWLNEFAADNEEDDFMFVYIGPKDSWTPFHCDVYSSFSWSVNIIGKKKWLILPPDEEKQLKDSLNNLPLLFKPQNYPNVRFIEVVQEKGDAIFVPSGWHHQVFNLETTISVNHNFINSCNIEIVWKSLLDNLLSVEHEIIEFKESPEYIEQCQLILKSVFGMDFVSFVKFISYIGEKRIKQLDGNKFLIFNKFTFSKHHIVYDLEKILQTINLIENNTLFTLLPKSMIKNLNNFKKYILNK